MSPDLLLETKDGIFTIYPDLECIQLNQKATDSSPEQCMIISFETFSKLAIIVMNLPMGGQDLNTSVQ